MMLLHLVYKEGTKRPPVFSVSMLSESQKNRVCVVEQLQVVAVRFLRHKWVRVRVNPWSRLGLDRVRLEGGAETTPSVKVRVRFRLL